MAFVLVLGKTPLVALLENLLDILVDTLDETLDENLVETPAVAC
jgi:hypothetical protein